MVGMPEAERDAARVRPEKEGAVSATITVKVRLRCAARRKDSTVREWPRVRMNSLRAELGKG